MLGAAYMLWLYQRVFFGKIEHEENKTLHDLNLRELVTFVPLIVILCFWIGLYPAPFLDFLKKPAAQIAETLQPGRFVVANAAAHATPVVATTEVRDEPIIAEGGATAKR